MSQGNRLTSLLGIEQPFLCSGMTYVSNARLAAAVSEAGGLGLIQIGHLTPEQARAEIQLAKRLTSKPFGIGLALMMPGARENAEVALDEQVPVINFSLGKGDWLCRRAHAYGGKVLATVVTERHAMAAERDGADALIVTGHEAAAHGGDVTTLVLIPAIRRVTALPIIAAGGFAGGEGLIAAQALGADAVAMGTRWAMTRESPLHDRTRELVLAKSVDDTLVTRNFDGMPCRIMATPTGRAVARKPLTPWRALWQSLQLMWRQRTPVSQVLRSVREQGVMEAIKLMYFGAAVERIRVAIEDGDHARGVQLIGQAQGLIDDVPSCAELMARLVADAEATRARLLAATGGVHHAA
ncbi:NAD(P)H-dependent flavin oxidoreductase [Perlucidibaca piscinae]|uniref:NAD(P)H-dependent flavin oxidoreductase n=1 Tax=Perlucidibaca piscinae TaxID=392589 RepID=UPI0003B2E79C|nr:nitronate monooxygenase [Perlucidibaca piscinae]